MGNHLLILERQFLASVTPADEEDGAGFVTMATTQQKNDALKLIETFGNKSSDYGWFASIQRSKVTAGLKERVNDPSKINTSSVNLCGPAALVYAVARDTPEKYVKFTTELFETGSAKLGKIDVKPSKSLKLAKLEEAKVNAADWVALASLRDSENFILDFSSAKDGASGITLPGKLNDWFKAAGYSKVLNETNLVFTKNETHARRASQLYTDGYKVALFINADMLQSKSQDSVSTIPNHWIMLSSSLTISASSVSFNCFTWGNGSRKVPQTGTLSLSSFLKHYYGFVAAKP